MTDSELEDLLARARTNPQDADDAVARLAEATLEDPDDASLRAFLALALHSAGHPTLALATMLEAALAAARPGAFSRFERVLTDYQRSLVDSALKR